MSLRDQVVAPYWFGQDALPGLDFCREIIEPGTNDIYPDGALGVRADDDFWAVAAFPHAFKDLDFATIIREFWPDYADRIRICPDSGSFEQKIYSYQQQLANLRDTEERLNKEVRRLMDENHRLRTARPGLVAQGTRTRHRLESDYFIKQYENVLTAFAHPAEARDEPDVAGMCRHCEMTLDHRVHSKRLIAKREAGEFSWHGDAIPSELPPDDPFEWD